MKTLIISSMRKDHQPSDYISYTDLHLGSRVRLTLHFLMKASEDMATTFCLANLQVSVKESSLKSKKQHKIQCSNQEVFEINKIQSVHESFSWAIPLYFRFASREKQSNPYRFFNVFYAEHVEQLTDICEQLRPGRGWFSEDSWTISVSDLQISSFFFK